MDLQNLHVLPHHKNSLKQKSKDEEEIGGEKRDGATGGFSFFYPFHLSFILSMFQVYIYKSNKTKQVKKHKTNIHYRKSSYHKHKYHDREITN